MSDYKPIDCRVYGRYETAIVRRQELVLSWRDERDVTHVERVRPRDLETLKGEEFLLADTDHGERLRLRLDRIIQSRMVSD